MENVTLMELVDEVRDLPLTVSAVLAQVISECDNADASVSSLARIMAGDQALAAMVLKLANSAYYGYARKIESLPDAVVPARLRLRQEPRHHRLDHPPL